jgi:hypothetical protein
VIFLAEAGEESSYQVGIPIALLASLLFFLLPALRCAAIAPDLPQMHAGGGLYYA